MLLAQFIRVGTQSLEALYPPQEARSLVLRLCIELLGIRSYTHIVEPLMEIDSEVLPCLKAALSRLEDGEPLQYVLGRADFCGRSFRVGPGVLIPRPETEILVEESLAAARGGKRRILDLCTGSGCIAWSLKLELPDSEVVAVDISEEALCIARNQFAGSHSPVFLQADILCEVPDSMGKFDLLVSNPPYVCESEKPFMHSNVLDHEPALALFVPDSDPLVFYRAIARWAVEVLDGTGIVEINEKLGPQTAALFTSYRFKDVSILKDLSGKDRFIRFTSPVERAI